LEGLNNAAIYDFTGILDNFYNDTDANPYTTSTEPSSTFFDLPLLINKFSNNDVPIILSLNVQSLNSKFELIKQLLNELIINKVNIIALAMQEIWQILHFDMFSIPGFSFVSATRSFGRGGGVGFYIRDGITFNTVPTLSPFHTKDFESLTVELNFNKKRYCLTSIYRSPSLVIQHTDSFFAKFDELLHNMNKPNMHYLLFLDSNFDLLKLNNSYLSKTYLEILHNNGFLQHIRKATRIQGNNFSLIDHICSKNTGASIDTGTVISDISDHFMTLVAFPPLHKQKSKTVFHRSFNQDAKNQFRDALSRISWEHVCSLNDVDGSFSEFWTTFSALYDIYFPLKRVKLNRNLHALNGFMTKGLLTSRANKNLLHRISIRYPTHENIEKYKTYRNLFNTLMRKSKSNYYSDLLSANKHNSKKTWDIYNEILCNKKNSSSSFKLNINGNITDDPLDVAEQFNAFFSSVGAEISNSIPNINPPNLTPNEPPNNLPPFEFDHINPTHICDILKALPPKKSCDLYGISNSLLKFISSQIAVPLAHIFDLSLKNGVFPSALKKSRVVPIFKTGDPLICDNYRPISLVSTVAKILEKIVSIKLTNFLELNKLIYPYQFGFQRGLSTEHNVLHLVNFVSKALNCNEYCIGIFLDLRKAFDTVSHKILLKKLENLGINGSALKWFESYLSDRSQIVDINGCFSSEKFINISVMQGSTLGPLLFLCFINDLNRASTLFSLLFADDTCLLAAGKNLMDLINYCNTEFQKITNWLIVNKLALNVKKCKYVIFHNKGKKIDVDTPPIVCNQNIIGENDDSKIYALDRIFNQNPNLQDRSYKYLGILIDEFLNFSDHVEQVCKKLSRGIFCLRRAKSVIDGAALRNLYFAFFNSHLNYCNTILSCTSQSNINRLTVLQKKAIRTITNSKYNDHTAELFQRLKIMPIDKLFTYNKLMFMHSVKHGYCHPSFSNTWTLNLNRQENYNLRNLEDFHLEFPNYENFKKMPIYSYPKAWNSIGDMKYQNNRSIFSYWLKNDLLASLGQQIFE